MDKQNENNNEKDHITIEIKRHIWFGRLLMAVLLLCVCTWVQAQAPAGATEAGTDEPTEAPADSALWAPMQAKKGYELHDYEDLTNPTTSLDLSDPENVQTVTDYDPATN